MINLKIWKSIKSLARAVFTKTVVVCVAVVTVTVSVCSSAFAQLDLTSVAVDTAPVFTIAVIVISALAGLWAIYKVIGLVRAR